MSNEHDTLPQTMNEISTIMNSADSAAIHPYLSSLNSRILRKIAATLHVRDNEWRRSLATKAMLVDGICEALGLTGYAAALLEAYSEAESTPTQKDEPAMNDKPAANSQDLARAIADAISGMLPAQEQTLDLDAIKALIGQELDGKLDSATTTMAEKMKEMMNEQDGKQTARLIIEIPGRPEVEIEGHQHENFEMLIDLLAAGLNVMMVGPAGSGKTHGGGSAAKALAMDFYAMSVGAQTTMSQLMGYMDATGKYITTVFRSAFELGGIFLLDEIDAGNPNVLTALNAALANDICGFPDGMVSKHPDFRCIAAANTYGNGQDRQYVGRNQLDATSLDRFATLDWNYDGKMEHGITGLPGWVNIVQEYRASIATLGIRHIVSPRASISGAKLLLQGKLDIEKIMDLVLWKSLDRATVKQVTLHANIGASVFKMATAEAKDLAAKHKADLAAKLAAAIEVEAIEVEASEVDFDTYAA